MSNGISLKVTCQDLQDPRFIAVISFLNKETICRDSVGESRTVSKDERLWRRFYVAYASSKLNDTRI